MALSGSKDYTPSVSDFVEEAYERCGLEIRAGWDAQSARNSINYMLADWANRGINNWTVDQVSQTMAIGITGGTSGATASVLTKPSSTTMELTVPTGTFAVSETITGGTSGATTTVSAAPSLVDTQNTIDIISAVIRRSSNDSSSSTSRLPLLLSSGRRLRTAPIS